MARWLGKTEPSVYSWDQLLRDGRTRWDGVRSAEARNNLRAMVPGDSFYIYHSNEGLAVVGLAQVVSAPYRDPGSDEGDERWLAIDIAPVATLPRPLPLSELKTDPVLANMALVRKGRLSVGPVTEAEHERLLTLCGLRLP